MTAALLDWAQVSCTIIFSRTAKHVALDTTFVFVLFWFGLGGGVYEMQKWNCRRLTRMFFFFLFFSLFLAVMILKNTLNHYAVRILFGFVSIR